MPDNASKPTVTPVTVLDVEMTKALQTTLEQGASAYIVYFDQHASGNPPVWTPLVEDGTLKAAGGKTKITLTSEVGGTFQDLNAGKIYILIQSGKDNLTQVIKSEADINWDSAALNDYRYDSFEVTLKNGPNDKGNLTSVNGFGVPMELSVTYSDKTTATAGYKISSDDLVQKISDATGQPIDNFKKGPLEHHYREMISPSVSVADKTDKTFAGTDWADYINSLKVADTGVQVAGFFNGAADAVVHGNGGIWHNAAFFGYTLEWDAGKKVFWLAPDEGSQVKGLIQLTETDLQNSIYSTLGNVGIYETKTSDPYKILDHAAVLNSNNDAATMNSGENNQWGAVLTQFLTGFSAGYYSQFGKPLNDLSTDKVDLSKSWNWDPTYAFGENLSSAGPIHKDKYSEVFFQNSNSYGSNYADNLMTQYTVGGPLMSMSDPSTGKNVKTISLTLFDDAETPTGYVTPSIANYIDADYTVPTGLSVDNNITLNLANGTVVVAEGTKISLDIMTGNGKGGPTWQTVEFAPAAGDSLWQHWELTKENGTYAAKAAGGSLGPGQMLIEHFPGTSAGTYWTRLNVGEGTSAKTFNLYTTIAKGSTEFVNPDADPTGASLAVDGLATIAPETPASGAPPATIVTFGVNLLHAATTTIAPEYLVYNEAASMPVPNAPVVGVMLDGAFKASAGQTNQVTNTVTVDDLRLAFGWTGENDDAGTRAWITKYTNKIGALNFAEIDFAQSSGPSVAPIFTRADLDGQWLSAETALGSGTYTVTMREHLPNPSHTNLPGTEIGPKSSPLTLTVETRKMDLEAVDNGTMLALAPSADAPEGNFVSLDVHRSPGVAGRMVAVYLVDSAGNPVEHGSLAEAASVKDAVVATIGSHHQDGGALMMHGSQTVYLPTGYRFAFGVVAPNGDIETKAPVSVRATRRRDRPDRGRRLRDRRRDRQLAVRFGRPRLGPAATPAVRSSTSRKAASSRSTPPAARTERTSSPLCGRRSTPPPANGASAASRPAIRTLSVRPCATTSTVNSRCAAAATSPAPPCGTSRAGRGTTRPSSSRRPARSSCSRARSAIPPLRSTTRPAAPPTTTSTTSPPASPFSTPTKAPRSKARLTSRSPWRASGGSRKGRGSSRRCRAATAPFRAPSPASPWSAMRMATRASSSPARPSSAAAAMAS